MSENLVPKLRFNDFEKDWEIKKLNDLSKIQRGASPRPISSKKWYDKTNKNVGWVRIGDVTKSSKYLSETEDYFSKEGIKKSRFLPKGSLIMSICATIGKPIITDIDTCIHDGFVGFSELDVNKEFLYYYLNILEPKFCALSQTGSQANLNSDLVRISKIGVPSLKEQEKIVNFLSAVDKKIELLEQKYQRYHDFKKYLMQQIFAQKLRFKGFEDEWKYISAGEIFKNVTNKNHDGTLPILAVTQDKGVVYRDSLDMEIKTSQNSVKTYKLIEPGDFVISLRSFQGGIEYSYIEGICSPAYTILKPKIEICDGFYKFYFKKDEFISRLNYAVIGIRDGKQISYKDFSEIKIPYTSVKEQKKIADFLSNIDKKIKIIQSQLLEIKEFKKGLLQQMFI